MDIVDRLCKTCENCKYRGTLSINYPCCDCLRPDLGNCGIFDGNTTSNVMFTKFCPIDATCIPRSLKAHSNESSNPYYEDDPSFGAKCDCKDNESCEQDKPEADVVNHPSHYETGKFQCINVMVEALGKEEVKGFCICNAFKYLYRCRRKNGLEDIKKARWYIDKFIELCEEDE